jgi:phospholipid/cholesterol/gamma-HCH transport system substrate-binding protein
MRTVSRTLKALRGATGRTLVKVVLYSLVCLAVLGALIGRIGNIDWFAEHEGYHAEMPDVTGLLVNDDVKVAGVRVGKVTGISVHRGRAEVSFEVKPGMELRSSTQVGVRWRNVLGQKYLYLYPGTQGKVLHAGATFPESQAVRSADVGEFLNSVAPILQAIDPAKANAFVRALNQALDGNEEKVRGLLSDTASISSELGGSDQQIGSLIENLDTVVGGLASRDEDLNTAVTRFKTLAASLSSNNDDLQLLVERFAAVQTRLNRLVTDNRGNLDATIDDLATIAKVLHRHRGDLEATLATLPQGLRIYDSISSYGQWFQIRTTITCLANQANCSAEGSTSDALSGGAPATPPDVGSIVGFALAGGGA